MKLDTLNRLYTRELDAFHAAVAQLQEELVQLGRAPCAAEMQPGLVLFLEQMRDLGNRLERIFSLVNEKYWGSVRLTTEEIRLEMQSLKELKAAAAAPAGRAELSMVRARR